MTLGCVNYQDIFLYSLGIESMPLVLLAQLVAGIWLVTGGPADQLFSWVTSLDRIEVI